jgi:hypothetical protein
MTTESKPLEGLEKMRVPFPANLVNKLPKGTKAQNECPANEKVNCKECGGWHHPKIIHLDYVGHAALTDRLLDTDPLWNWEPLALHDGLPAFDTSGGLWIRLTVCGHTRLGYGHAPASSFKEIGSREKEVIGDALRNAAMRFGAALDLWHKGDLHVAEETETKEETGAPPKQAGKASDTPNPDTPMPKVNQDLHNELAAYCMGDTVKMDTVLKRITHYEKDGTEYEFGLDRIATVSAVWAGKTLTAVRKMVSAESAAEMPDVCADCGKVMIDGKCQVCPF